MIEYREWITRRMLRDEPDKLFVFGDNMERKGLGGQAKEMRGEPNAVGIPTKRAPSMEPSAFLSDDDFGEWLVAVEGDKERLFEHIGTIVWPKAGIGTGLARLEETAPRISHAIDVLQEIIEVGY